MNQPSCHRAPIHVSADPVLWPIPEMTWQLLTSLLTVPEVEIPPPSSRHAPRVPYNVVELCSSATSCCCPIWRKAIAKHEECAYWEEVGYKLLTPRLCTGPRDRI